MCSCRTCKHHCCEFFTQNKHRLHTYHISENCKLIYRFKMVWALKFCCHLVETKCMSSESLFCLLKLVSLVRIKRFITLFWFCFVNKSVSSAIFLKIYSIHSKISPFSFQVHWSSCCLLSGGEKGGTICYDFKKDQAKAWQRLRPSLRKWDRTFGAQTSRPPQCLQTHSCHPGLPRLHSTAHSTALCHHSGKIRPSHTA